MKEIKKKISNYCSSELAGILYDAIKYEYKFLDEAKLHLRKGEMDLKLNVLYGSEYNGRYVTYKSLLKLIDDLCQESIEFVQKENGKYGYKVWGFSRNEDKILINESYSSEEYDSKEEIIEKLLGNCLRVSMARKDYPGIIVEDARPSL